MYREHVPTGRWRDDLVCAWSSVTGATDGDPRPVVPDGCVDLLWSSTDGLVVVGAMTRPVLPRFPVGTEHVALRLRPGHAPRVLGVPATELTDRQVPVGEVLGAPGRRLSERLHEAGGTADRVALLTALHGVTPAGDVDAAPLAALRWLVARPDRYVPQAADHVGLSPRQLQRRVTAAVGYGPKRFQRVVRVQRVLGAAAGPGHPHGRLAELAAALGFADQAHLSREVRQLTGRPPHHAMSDARPTLVSGTFKAWDTATAHAGWSRTVPARGGRP